MLKFIWLLLDHFDDQIDDGHFRKDAHGRYSDVYGRSWKMEYVDELFSLDGHGNASV